MKKYKLIIAILIIALIIVCTTVVVHSAIQKLNNAIEDAAPIELVEMEEFTVNEHLSLEPEQKDEEDVIEEIQYYTEDEVVMMAKLIKTEANGLRDTELACVAWCVCNRVDDSRFKGDTISEIITRPGQFAYRESTNVNEHYYDIALDVIKRWNSERNGKSDVGRVLPREYVFFWGDGKHNYFRVTGKSYDYWDYSLESPYEN